MAKFTATITIAINGERSVTLLLLGKAGGMEHKLTIAILSSYRKQAMIPQGSSFCILLEVVLLYPLTVKTVLSVRCHKHRVAFCQHDIISGQNGGRGKTERQRIVRFSIRYQVVRSLLFSLLISQYVGGSLCNSA